MPTPTNPAEYCRSLRDMVQKGIYDFYTANAMWQKYRGSLRMFGLDPGPCALGAEGPPQPVIGAGGDGGLSLAGPDAAYGVRDAAAGAGPISWSPRQQPQINLGFDPSAGATDPGSHLPSSSVGSSPFRGTPAPDAYAPGPPAARPALQDAVPPYALPQAEVMALGPDGTYIPVPYMPRRIPQPQPVAATPSPFEGVPVTSSFGIRDS